MKQIQVELITPEGPAFGGEAQAVQVPGMLGSFQVLFDHAPLISALDKGPVTILLPNNTDVSFQIEGGVAEVLNNKVIILAEKIVE